MSTPNVPDVGDLWPLVVRFYSDEAQTALADPDEVTLEITDPAGVTTTPAPVRLSLGFYSFDWQPAVRGIHTIEWTGTGAVQVVEQSSVAVRGVEDPAADLTNLQTVRRRMSMPGVDVDRDVELQDLISAVSAHLVETYEQEWVPAGAAPEERAFTYRGGGILNLSPCNAQAGTVTAITITPDGGTAVDLVAGTDWVEMPARSKWGVTDYIRLRSGLASSFSPQIALVTATWGYPAVPEVVHRAATITVIHWYREQSSRPSGFTEPDEGSLDDRVAIPQRARWMLRPFERLVVT